MDNIVACEGMEQRILLTGMAVRDNEIKQHQNFSEKHFLGVATCGFCLLGMMKTQCGMKAVPVYVTRLGDKKEIMWLNVILSSDTVKSC